VNDRHLKSALNAKDTLCIGALLHRRQIFDWKHHALVFISYVKNLRNRWSLLLPLRGFTLAEVLITLGIIGVVAALTIPTLMQKSDERETVSKVKLAYSTISNAIRMAEAENGQNCLTDGIEHSNEYALKVAEYIKPQLNLLKDCGLDDTSGNCIFNDAYKTLNGGTNGTFAAPSFHAYKVMLNNGLGIFWHGTGENLDFYVDVNGPKGPNTWGRDLFEVLMYKADSHKMFSEGYGDNAAQCPITGYGCAYYVLQNGNMDYLNN
ncbi:type II secretion system protein, partial [bacterium]|nr:type II secretion system protein [bacterium]